MVSIICIFQGIQAGRGVHSKSGCQGMDLRTEIILDLLLCQAADGRIALIHGYVHQMVQIRENANLGEFCDAGEELEADMRVAPF